MANGIYLSLELLKVSSTRGLARNWCSTNVRGGLYHLTPFEILIKTTGKLWKSQDANPDGLCHLWTHPVLHADFYSKSPTLHGSGVQYSRGSLGPGAPQTLYPEPPLQALRRQARLLGLLHPHGVPLCLGWHLTHEGLGTCSLVESKLLTIVGS